MVITPSQVDKIDEWRKEQQGLPSRSEAIRRLVQIGIDSEPIIKEMLDFLERHGDPADAETQAQMVRLRGILGGQ